MYSSGIKARFILKSLSNQGYSTKFGSQEFGRNVSNLYNQTKMFILLKDIPLNSKT